MTIGVDLGGTNIRAGIREGDSIIKKAQTALKEKDSFESTLAQLFNLIRPLISNETQGIGIAAPSIVDTPNGIVYNVVNIPSWQKVELKSILEEEFKLPAAVENDANCFVLGEHHHGKAKGFANVVGITLGTGVGSGVIVDNKIFSGKNGGAGEVGYINYLDRDFEFYGGSFFFHEIHKVSARETYDKAMNRDTPALTIWNEYGVHIGNLIKTVVYAYDPEVVIFGGSIAKASAFFSASMLKTIKSDFHFPGSMAALKILFSDNEDITLLGASSLISR
jgi:glucokinase